MICWKSEGKNNYFMNCDAIQCHLSRSSFRLVGARGLPARLILSLGAMGWGSGRIQKLFRRRLFGKHVQKHSHRGKLFSPWEMIPHRGEHCIYEDFAAPAASTAPTHPSIKESTKGGGGRRPPAPLCGGGRRPPPLWMGVWGLGRQQAQQNIHKYM